MNVFSQQQKLDYTASTHQVLKAGYNCLTCSKTYSPLLLSWWNFRQLMHTGRRQRYLDTILCSTRQSCHNWKKKRHWESPCVNSSDIKLSGIDEILTKAIRHSSSKYTNVFIFLNNSIPDLRSVYSSGTIHVIHNMIDAVVVWRITCNRVVGYFTYKLWTRTNMAHS